MICATAEDIARSLGGKPCGQGQFLISCPAPGHGRGRGDRNPSCSLANSRNGTLLVYCHAGCDPADILGALRARGLIVGGRGWSGRRRPVPIKKENIGGRTGADNVEREVVQKRQQALRIWDACEPPQNSLVEVYLQSRGLNLPDTPNLRFHPGLRHPKGGDFPAMVALITHGLTGEPIAISRTFLAPDGNGKARVEPVKMMLGGSKGGCVRLGPAADHILVGEGIETCLAVMQVVGIPAWAALSTSGLKGLDPQPEVGTVTILVDGDEDGANAAMAAAERWHYSGCQVRFLRAPKGCDFNDVLAGSDCNDGGVS